MKKRVYNGVRATGKLHLGNYYGSVKGMLALQDEYDCVFSVVDLHAMTTPYDKDQLKISTRSVILDFLAAGLDPEKAKFEIQSQIPQHTELAYLLSTVYSLAPLQDLPTYKEKIAQYPKNVTVALLYYPILMAADVHLYKGELIPVGLDQEPHMEVMREVARKFNQIYGETFKEPQRFKTPGEYVPSLTGKGKMSKSVEDSYIALTDDYETIKRKVAKIPTDSGIRSTSDPIDLDLNGIPEEVEGPQFGVLPFVELFQGTDRADEYRKEYVTRGIRYSELKAELAEAIYKELEPIQEKRKYFEENPKLVDEILEKSREECLVIARETIKEVKEKMGLLL